MAIVQNINNVHQFREAFRLAGRSDQFSYEGKKGHAEKIYQIVGKSGLKVEYNAVTITNQMECV